MRKLVRHVTRPSRVRRHHVLLAIIGCGLLVHEANAALRWFGESKQELARDTEQRMLDEFALWSFHECPDSAQALRASGDAIDPWGNPVSGRMHAGARSRDARHRVAGPRRRRGAHRPHDRAVIFPVAPKMQKAPGGALR